MGGIPVTNRMRSASPAKISGRRTVQSSPIATIGASGGVGQLAVQFARHVGGAAQLVDRRVDLVGDQEQEEGAAQQHAGGQGPGARSSALSRPDARSPRRW